MNEIYITDACALFADKLTPDEKIVKGSKFYFSFINHIVRYNNIIKYNNSFTGRIIETNITII